jgi:drug/metabolite transporter (DMT)-like permease
MADMALMAGVGLVAGCAQLALVMAYRSAPIGTVAPFDYVALVWAALFGFVVFAEVPSWLTLLGSAIVAGSGITIVLAESRRGGQRT